MITRHLELFESLDGFQNLDTSKDWKNHNPTFKWTDEDLAEFEFEEKFAQRMEAMVAWWNMEAFAVRRSVVIRIIIRTEQEVMTVVDARAPWASVGSNHQFPHPRSDLASHLSYLVGSPS